MTAPYASDRAMCLLLTDVSALYLAKIGGVNSCFSLLLIPTRVLTDSLALAQLLACYLSPNYPHAYFDAVNQVF